MYFVNHPMEITGEHIVRFCGKGNLERNIALCPNHFGEVMELFVLRKISIPISCDGSLLYRMVLLVVATVVYTHQVMVVIVYPMEVMLVVVRIHPCILAEVWVVAAVIWVVVDLVLLLRSKHNKEAAVGFGIEAYSHYDGYHLELNSAK
ncbi:hypothetical protein VNO78_15123 [Psophocarpus tetragonolobus]|uniref:Transmembrane protein n=1 Tax=Psophocarpus tetragonolobus TaxID=3891 RepID=A0AAN9SE18_PSOTE